MKHVPNTLSVVRIVLTPVVLVLLLSQTYRWQVLAVILFAVAAVSDWLDGKLARTYKARSRLGKFLDPLADKILVLTTFLALPVLVPTVVPWWAVALIALRDVVVTGLRTWTENRGQSFPTLQVARMKTLTQLLFLGFMLMLIVAAKAPGESGEAARSFLYGPIPYAVLMVVVAFTVYTGVVYVSRFPRINRPAA